MGNEQDKRCEIVLWNVGLAELPVIKTIKCFFSDQEILYQYYHANQKIPELTADKNYLIFYSASDEIEEKKAREYRKKKRLNFCYAALCRNDQEGIKAMRKGDFYALLLPLKQEKIRNCIDSFLQSN